MSFLNLSIAELIAVFLPISAAVVAMYLYDRAHRRQIVSTLRFFRQASQSPVFTRRKKIQQPWSLLLQIISLALLLLAIAQPQWSRRAGAVRNHVLILETSAWMNSAAPPPPGAGGGTARPTLMQVAQRRAIDYLHAVPVEDQVMLVRADELATPATPFTRDRQEIESAIRVSAAGAAALNLPAAIELARSSQQTAQNRPGEIAFVGSGRAMRQDLDRLGGTEISNLRAILLGGEPDNCGIRKLSARRSLNDPLSWDLDVGAYNYGASARRTTLTLTFNGARIAAKPLSIDPHSAAEASFTFHASGAGLLDASLDIKDDFRADNHAAIELPHLMPLKVQVFSDRPDLWKPLLTASSAIAPEFLRRDQYSAGGPAHRLVILDGFEPAEPPNADSVTIHSAISQSAEKAATLRWSAVHPLAAGLHNRDLRLGRAYILAGRRPEEVVAESDKGPVLAASIAGGFKRVTFGFEPVADDAGSHLAIPLLFANVVRWVSPDLFRAAEISARPPGLVEVETSAGLTREQVQVQSDQIRGLPTTLVGNRLRFFAGQAGTVRVSMPDRELEYRLTLPEIGDSRWSPPAGTRMGVPPPAPGLPLNREIWPWLALAGALGLLLEWILYGRQPELPVPAGQRPSSSPSLGLNSWTARAQQDEAAEEQEVRR
jgi:hypothetical protein